MKSVILNGAFSIGNKHILRVLEDDFWDAVGEFEEMVVEMASRCFGDVDSPKSHFVLGGCDGLFILHLIFALEGDDASARSCDFPDAFFADGVTATQGCREVFGAFGNIEEEGGWLGLEV